MFIGIIHLSVSVIQFLLFGGMLFFIGHSFVEGEGKVDTHRVKLRVVMIYDIDGGAMVKWKGTVL